ncbi:hypothetical protein RHGRI_004722 [Rhododendron griersonianum]|uniref:Secreted protein n=1 Tax=Rhododendron griersonianum TaxID=479676 RepID=A0AAV6L9P6_9ERIC|nr:hypothetical protein RHGRI_004722 [Rhododendron griersonianum]
MRLSCAGSFNSAFLGCSWEFWCSGVVFGTSPWSRGLVVLLAVTCQSLKCQQGSHWCDLPMLVGFARRWFLVGFVVPSDMGVPALTSSRHHKATNPSNK